MMTALMYKKPDDHIQFLESCLERAKADPKIRWHSFIEPLPPIFKENGRIKSELQGKSEDMKIEKTPTFAKDESALPPIPYKGESEFGAASQNDANSVTEKVFQQNMSHQTTAPTDENGMRPWYADYTEKKVDTSALQEKPIVFVLGKYVFNIYIFQSFH